MAGKEGTAFNFDLSIFLILIAAITFLTLPIIYSIFPAEYSLAYHLNLQARFLQAIPAILTLLFFLGGTIVYYYSELKPSWLEYRNTKKQ